MVYDLAPDVIRWDATTVSGAHEVTEGGLVPLGHRTDDPTRPQIQVMLGSFAPLGMPLATDVLSGERADDGLDIPIIRRIRTGWTTPGLLFVGDGKRRALETRASLARHQEWYLSPLPLTGATAEAMDAWIAAGVRQREAGTLAQIWRTTDRGHEGLVAEGEEVERTCHAPGSAGATAAWNARVLVVRSPMHADHQTAGRDPMSGPHASQRAGETAHHHRGDAEGGHGSRAPDASGGGFAQRHLGTASRADHALCGAGTRLGEPREAGERDKPLPPPPDRASGRSHRRSAPTVGLEGVGHQGGS